MMKFPQSSLALIELFALNRIQLTEREFDDHFDVVLEVLERANNEKHRLTHRSDSASSPEDI